MDKNIIKNIIREEIQKINEEFSNGILYGYHITSFENWESIKNDGLKTGKRAMQGNGLYAFYDYSHAVRYATKGEVKNPIIVKFEVIRPKRFLILNMEIAKEVFGENYSLLSQIENYFYEGFEGFYDYAKKINPNLTIEDLKSKILNIENNNSESNQRTFVFELIPSSLNDRLNIIWNGNYGLEYHKNIAETGEKARK